MCPNVVTYLLYHFNISWSYLCKVEEERQAIINRDNKRLASNIADIQHSKGRVDNQNIYPERSLNYDRRRARLLQVCHENQMIHERIIAQESEYRRELWEEEWARSTQWRDGITHYPRGVTDKQKMTKSVNFLGEAPGNPSSITEENETTDEDHSEDVTE